MNLLKFLALAAVPSLFLMGRSEAYDLGAHARITLNAYNQSRLAAKFYSLGLHRGGATLLGPYYFDFEADYTQTIYVRTIFGYDREPMPSVTWIGRSEPDPENQANIEALTWLMRGDVREDDGAWLLGYLWLINKQIGALAPCSGNGPDGCSNVYSFQPPPAVHVTIDQKFQ